MSVHLLVFAFFFCFFLAFFCIVFFFRSMFCPPPPPGGCGGPSGLPAATPRIAADEDCFAVGKLLHTLGVFVECCGVPAAARAPRPQREDPRGRGGGVGARWAWPAPAAPSFGGRQVLRGRQLWERYCGWICCRRTLCACQPFPPLSPTGAAHRLLHLRPNRPPPARPPKIQTLMVGTKGVTQNANQCPLFSWHSLYCTRSAPEFSFLRVCICSPPPNNFQRP